ncbi:helix-turn-helix transcriptional regulator [Jutongia sp.]|uniref:helix-turn-helix transcriptional regulator n=1 Tax=Jutongia sp. TaxID=2944204 RepID=UPI00307A2293
MINLQPKVIGKRLLELRGEKSQAEVAQAVGISDSALSMYECGERIPRDSVKVKLAQYYKTTVQKIFFD